MSYPMWLYGGMQATVSSRHGVNPNHNIWNNNGTWWCHYTVHRDDYTKQRVRVSLHTKDVEIARALRDFVMEAAPAIAAGIPQVRTSLQPPRPAAASPHSRPCCNEIKSNEQDASKRPTKHPLSLRT